MVLPVNVHLVYSLLPMFLCLPCLVLPCVVYIKDKVILSYSLVSVFRFYGLNLQYKKLYLFNWYVNIPTDWNTKIGFVPLKIHWKNETMKKLYHMYLLHMLR